MRDLHTRKEMKPMSWIYAGSRVMPDGTFAADATGYVISVVNFDLTHEPETYVHRVGRTGRADEAGHAITLVSPAERHAWASIEKSVGVVLE